MVTAGSKEKQKAGGAFKKAVEREPDLKKALLFVPGSLITLLTINWSNLSSQILLI